MIAKKGDAVVVPAVCARLADEGWKVRAAAVLALVRIAKKGDAQVVAALSALLEDESKAVESKLKSLAARALTQITEKDKGRTLGFGPGIVEFLSPSWSQEFW